MSDIISIDVDLRRIHAWSRDHGTVCYKASSVAPLLEFVRSSDEPCIVLMEVASAQSYTDGDAAKLYNKRRWMIYNMAIAGELSVHLGPLLLVSPSSSWTCGYPEKERQLLAKADAKNHDLKECQTMIDFYRRAPNKWHTYDNFKDEIL